MLRVENVTKVFYPNTINEDAWNFAPVKRLVDFVSDSSDDVTYSVLC